jgi:hypothetical protein
MVAQGCSTGAIGRLLPIPHHCALAGHLMDSIGPAIVCLFGAVSQITSVVYPIALDVSRGEFSSQLPHLASGQWRGRPRQGTTSYLTFQITPSSPEPNEPIKEANHALNHGWTPILLEIIGLEPSTTFWSGQTGNVRLLPERPTRGQVCFPGGESSPAEIPVTPGKSKGVQTAGAGCILICVQDGAIKAVLICLLEEESGGPREHVQRKRKRTGLCGGRLP